MSENLIERMQAALKEASIPAWLFYGFRDIDPIGVGILGFGEAYHATRRWFYLVPSEGEPLKLVHRIESGMLDHLPGSRTVYLSWEQFHSSLESLLQGYPQVAMQFSSVPAVSRVDAGTVDAVRACGTEVVSAENLVQMFSCIWSPDQVRGHRHAADVVTETVMAAFQETASRISSAGSVTEYEVQQFIMSRFAAEGLVTDSPPIVGVNANASDPHYVPTAEVTGTIGPGDFLLIDLFAREDFHDSIFADITWTACFGSTVPDRISEVFDVVTRARDKGFELLAERSAASRTVQGWEVDDAVRQVTRDAGLSEYFVHRTGHNLGHDSPHGDGVNFDNLETHDTRDVIPGVGCTIEPGIYLPEFGVRSEINVYMAPGGPEITTPPQKELLVFDV